VEQSSEQAPCNNQTRTFVPESNVHFSFILCPKVRQIVNIAIMTMLHLRYRKKVIQHLKLFMRIYTLGTSKWFCKELFY
jgi:hypothetical protein